MKKSNIICVGCESGRTASTKGEKISTYDYQVKSVRYYGGSVRKAVEDLQPMVDAENKGAFRLHYYVIYNRCTDNTWTKVSEL